MTILTYIVAGLVMISLVVVIHEFGHFIVARFFGIGTPVFSVGMGPRLFGFQWKDTDFRVSALPIGGYVQMAGADPFGEEDADSWVDPEQDFMKKPVWQRFLVMLAGPAMNIALPFVLFTAVLMLGDTLRDNVVNQVMPETAAAAAGLQAGDRIVAVDGQPVVVWDDLYSLLSVEKAGPIALTVERGGAVRELTLPAGALALGPDGLPELQRLGITHYQHSARVGVSDRHPRPHRGAGRRGGPGDPGPVDHRHRR
jgi:regulator of sigma E protease